MPGTSVELIEAFEKAAARFPLDGDRDLLLTRFDMLLKYKTESDEQKMQLVKALYNCTLQLLKQYTQAKPARFVRHGDVTAIPALLAALESGECLPHAPAGGPMALADVASDLLDRAETIKDDDIADSVSITDYKNKMITFARNVLKTADAFRAAEEDRTVDIKTARDFMPGKPIVLKQKYPPASGEL